MKPALPLALRERTINLSDAWTLGRPASTYRTSSPTACADRCRVHRRPRPRRARCPTQLRAARPGCVRSDPWRCWAGQVAHREPPAVHAGRQRYRCHERRVREERIEVAQPSGLLGRRMGGAGSRSTACGLRAACRTAHRDARRAPSGGATRIALLLSPGDACVWLPSYGRARHRFERHAWDDHGAHPGEPPRCGSRDPDGTREHRHKRALPGCAGPEPHRRGTTPWLRGGLRIEPESACSGDRRAERRDPWCGRLDAGP